MRPEDAFARIDAHELTGDVGTPISTMCFELGFVARKRVIAIGSAGLDINSSFCCTPLIASTTRKGKLRYRKLTL
jgi:hypothetical protein